MSRTNRKGRSKGDGAFVALYRYMTDSSAWRALTPAQRCVYIEITAVYDGNNNGYLGLGARRAADQCNISKNSAPTCFRALVDKGFIECAVPGSFNTNGRKQTEWRLTAYRCDRTGAAPTKAFMKWRAAKSISTSQTRDAMVPIEGQSAPEPASSVPHLVPKRSRSAA